MAFWTPQFPRLHYTHQNAQRLSWVIRNQRLSPFNDCEGPMMHSFEWLFADILEPSLDCSKAVCLLKCHKRLIPSIQRTELFPLLIAQREGLWWSRLFDYTPHLVSITAILRICLLETSGFLGRQQQALAKAQYSEKFKLKFVRILMTHPVYAQCMEEDREKCTCDV